MCGWVDGWVVAALARLICFVVGSRQAAVHMPVPEGLKTGP